MNLKSKKGFTLVELIIVIAILGIIALIAVPNLTGIQQRSQVNADIRTAEQIGKAVRIWLTDTGAGTDRLDILKGVWVKLGSDITDLDQYVSLDYVPNSFVGDGSETGAYYVQVAAPTTDTTGADNRVVVAIAADDAAAADIGTAAYVQGKAAGVAYVEGVSKLDATNISKIDIKAAMPAGE